MSSLGLREHVAEPANVWIRHSFSRWPSGGGVLWCDLPTGGLPRAAPAPASVASKAADVSASEAADLVRSATDVVCLPPLPAAQVELRSSVVAAAAEAGVPLLVQVVADFDSQARQFVLGGPAPDSDRASSLADGPASAAGQPAVRSDRPASAAGWPAARSDGPAPLADELAPTAALPPNAVVAVDLLDALVRHAAALRRQFRERRQPVLPFEPRPLAGAAVVWPLVAGWTDQPELLASAMARLAAAGARRVAPRVLELAAPERRLLADRLQSAWPEAFDALFHGGETPPDARAVRDAAEAAGLEPRLPRPLPAPPLPRRLRRARELAGRLIELGDAAGDDGPAYYRAARFLDRGEVDIDAAAREGNLGVLPWLEEPARAAVEAWLSEGAPTSSPS